MKKITFALITTILFAGCFFFPNHIFAQVVPGAPTGVTAVPGDGSAQISFTPPTNASGVYQYLAVASPGGAKTAGNSPLLVTGLTNGTAYTFTVQAQSYSGVGPFSAASAPVTPVAGGGTPSTAPNPPISVIATAGDSQATVSFTPSSTSTGVYQYIVVPNNGTSDSSGTTTTATTATVTGLTDGTTYTFKVAAQSYTGGQSAYSVPSNAVTPQTATNLTPPPGSSTPGANGYGCTSNGTTSYCMLAPLPIPDQNGNIDATGKVDTTQGFGTYVNGIIKLVMGLIGVLAVLMIVVGGIEYMSTVSIGEKEGAKSRIMNAILGLLLALGSYVILSTINPNLVNITVTVPGANLGLSINSDGPAPTTTGTTQTGGATFTGTEQCAQVGGSIQVQVSVNGSTSTVSMPLATGVPWPSDTGQSTPILQQVTDQFFPAWKGQSLSLLGDNGRTTLTNAGISINAGNCSQVGATGCTSVYGYAPNVLNDIIALKSKCAANGCNLTVTGGTECWLHASHGPGLQTVDLREDSGLVNYVTGSGSQKTCISWNSGTGGTCTLASGGQGHYAYTTGGTTFVDEGDHFHVKQW